MQRDQRAQRGVAPPPRARPLAGLAVAGRGAARGRVELGQRLARAAGRTALVRPWLAERSSIRLVVHLTGSFHRVLCSDAGPGRWHAPGRHQDSYGGTPAGGGSLGGGSLVDTRSRAT